MDMNLTIEFIRTVSIQYLGFDAVEFAQTPAMRGLVVFYCFCLAYLAIQIFRKKCWFDYSLFDLGVMELYLLWGLGSFGCYAMVLRETVIDYFPVLKLICALIFLGLFILIANRPLKFLVNSIKRYGLSGIAYWFALMGIGLIGVILVLLEFVVAILPLIGIFLVLGFCAAREWESYTTYQSEDDD